MEQISYDALTLSRVKPMPIITIPIAPAHTVELVQNTELLVE